MNAKKIAEKIKKVIGEKAGTSMVELLVAFIIVMLMTTMFSQIISASVRMLQQSRTIIERNEAFEEKYYQTSERTQDKREPICESFQFSVDTEKTDRRNQAKEATLTLKQGELRKYVYTQEDGNTSITRYSIETDNSSRTESGGE